MKLRGALQKLKECSRITKARFVTRAVVRDEETINKIHELLDDSVSSLEQVFKILFPEENVLIYLKNLMKS